MIIFCWFASSFFPFSITVLGWKFINVGRMPKSALFHSFFKPPYSCWRKQEKKMVRVLNCTKTAWVIRKGYGLSHKQDLAVGTEAVARSKSGIVQQELEQQVLSFPLSWWTLLGIFYVLVSNIKMQIVLFFFPSPRCTFHSDPECRKFENCWNGTGNIEMRDTVYMTLNISWIAVFLYPAITFSVSSIIRSHTLLTLHFSVRSCCDTRIKCSSGFQGGSAWAVPHLSP